MEMAIGSFNKEVANMFDPQKHQADLEVLEAMKEYAKDGLLEDKTYENAQHKHSQTKAEIDKTEREYRSKYNVSPREKHSDMFLLQDIENKEEALGKARAKLMAKEDAMHQQAKSNVLPPEQSPLQAVAKTADGDEKRAVRRANKQVKDPLAERAAEKAKNRR